jgi:transposase-like protein
MPRYSEEIKEQVVRKMMPPNAMSVAQVSLDTTISQKTLYKWRNQYRKEGKAVPADPSNPESWSGENKLAVVIETAALNNQELSEYCRRKGLYAEQGARWREAAIAGNESHSVHNKTDQRTLLNERNKSRNLEKDLRRKEKALAEAAALLILQKKSLSIWGEDEVA